MNVDINSLKADLKSDLEKLPKVSGGSAQLYMSSRPNNVLTKAKKIASDFKSYVSVEHLYLAILILTIKESRRLMISMVLIKTGHEVLTG